jgi:hypothetical protein
MAGGKFSMGDEYRTGGGRNWEEREGCSPQEAQRKAEERAQREKRNHSFES